MNRAIFCWILLLAGSLQAQPDTTQAAQWKTISINFADSTQWDSALWYAEQSERAWDQLAKPGSDSLLQVRWCQARIHQTDLLVRKGDMKGAFEQLTSLPSEVAAIWGDSHILLGLAQLKLANAANQLRRFELADSLYGKTIEVYEPHYGANDPNVIGVIRNRGSLYMTWGKLTEAEELMRQALTLYQQQPTTSARALGETHQSLGNILANQEREEAAVEQYDLAATHLAEAFDAPHSSLALLYNSQAIVEQRLGLYQVAEAHYLAADSVFLLTVGPNHPYRANNFHSLSSLFRVQGDMAKALEYGEQSLYAYQRSLPANHPSIGRAYLALGVIARNGGNFPQAAEYFQQGKAIHEQSYPPDHPRMGGMWMAVGNGYYSMQQFEAAIESYEKSLPIYQAVLGKENRHVAGLLHNLASAYEGIDRFDKSYELHEEAHRMLQRLSGIAPEEVARSEQLLGIIRLRMGNHQAAIPHFEAAIQLYQQAFGQVHPELASNYNYLGHSHFKLGRMDLAQQAYQAAIQANVPGFTADDPHQLPLATARPMETRTYLNSLIAKARVWWNDPSAHESEQRLASDCLAVGLACIIDVRQHFAQDEDKIALQQTHQLLFQQAAALNYELFHETNDSLYFQRFFTVSEQSRSIVLKEGLQASNSLQLSGAPAGLQAVEARHRNQLGTIETDILALQSAAQPDSARLLELKQQELQQLRSFDSLLRVFETEYPRYFDLKYAQPAVKWQAVQAALYDAETQFVSYFLPAPPMDHALNLFGIATTYLYVCSIRKDGVSLRRKPISAAWRMRYQQFMDQMTDVHLIAEFGREKNYQNELGRNSLWLFQDVLGPEWEHPHEKLIIASSGELGYLPFEALVASQPEGGWHQAYDQWPFVLKEARCQYSYSAALFLQTYQKDWRATRGLLAYGPEYLSKQGEEGELDERKSAQEFFPLKYNQAEASAVAGTMGGTAVIGSKAQKAHFLAEAPQHQVLHLSMHGFLDEHNPLYSGLVFSQGNDSSEADTYVVYAYEILQQPLAADLVVLSACNSGTGQLEQVEGIMSLGRAFRYAGAPNVVMSLWQIDDEATAVQMETFYAALSQDKGKAEALHEAKLRYVQESRWNHPFYWAPLILLGNDAPLAPMSRRSHPLGWIFGGILFLMLLGGWWRNNSSKTR
ncbi:MAG: CHAT domain-containing tetratricopeptide repeat protein [Bacteroidota bacterium]